MTERRARCAAAKKNRLGAGMKSQSRFLDFASRRVRFANAEEKEVGPLRLPSAGRLGMTAHRNVGKREKRTAKNGCATRDLRAPI
jgi:hypothetical protein